MRIAIIRGRGVIAPHVTDDYFHAFKELEHDVILVQLDQYFGTKGYEEIINFKPHFILAYGYVGIVTDTNGRFVWREHKIPVVCLHYDNPLFSLNEKFKNEFKEFPTLYFHFVWDQYCKELFEKSGVPNVNSIMLATNPNRFYPQEDILTRENELAFVGSIKHTPFSNSQQHLEQQFIDYVIKQKINKFETPLFEICIHSMSLPRFEPVRILFEKYAGAFWKNVYYPIHSIGSSIYRKHVLGSLEGVDLYVYGASEKLNESMINQPAIPYEELSGTYQKHAVNLNISSLQLETSVNNRVFDVFASKAFVLSDYKQDMEKVFPGVWEALVYKDLDDLLIKADYYLTHKKEREELVLELHRHVLEEHTYKHRAIEVINVLNASTSQDGNAI